MTLTLNIPLTGETLPPQAMRLLDAVREFVESGHGTVDLQEPAPVRGGPAEVRLLCASRRALIGGEEAPLTRLEFDLLRFLAEHPRRVFSRMQLLAAVWGYEHTSERTVDVHVRRLRLKTRNLPLITTIYGVGYRLADEAEVAVLAGE